MPDISIQFYALPQELCDFAKDEMSEFGLHALVMRFRPFEAIEIQKTQFDELIRNSSMGSRFGSRFYFMLETPQLPAEDSLNFQDKNPDCLRLDVGRLTEEGLEQSWLSCRTGDKEAFAVWKKIAARLKSITKSGAIVTNRQTGQSGERRYLRYSAGAKTLEGAGVTMLSSVGPKGQLIKLGLLTDAE